MIRLTRLNGQEIVVNADLVESLEAHPDTVVSLATGSKIMVKETMDQVTEKIMAYRKELSQTGTPHAATLLKTYKKEVR